MSSDNRVMTRSVIHHGSSVDLFTGMSVMGALTCWELKGFTRARSDVDRKVEGQEWRPQATAVSAKADAPVVRVEVHLSGGPPDCGNTLLATRLPGILPPMLEAEALERASIGSVSGRGVDLARWKQRPYRSSHHTVSAVALVGGGAEPRPGEISLAHHGVLFLDEHAL